MSELQRYLDALAHTQNARDNLNMAGELLATDDANGYLVMSLKFVEREVESGPLRGLRFVVEREIARLEEE